MTPILITVDPGETVGYAVVDLVARTPVAPVSGQKREVEWRLFLVALDTYLATQPDGSVIVVCERFTITTETAKKSPQPRALKVIGAVEWLVARHGQMYGDEQQPASAMKMATDAVLHGLGWWRPGEEHANDALRHAVYWLVTNGWLLPGEVLDAADREA